VLEDAHGAACPGRRDDRSQSRLHQGIARLFERGPRVVQRAIPHAAVVDRNVHERRGGPGRVRGEHRLVAVLQRRRKHERRGKHELRVGDGALCDLDPLASRSHVWTALEVVVQLAGARDGRIERRRVALRRRHGHRGAEGEPERFACALERLVAGDDGGACRGHVLHGPVDVDLRALSVLQAGPRERESIERCAQADSVELRDARGGQRRQHGVDGCRSNLAALILERELRGLDRPVGGAHAVDAPRVHRRPRDRAADAEDVRWRGHERDGDERGIRGVTGHEGRADGREELMGVGALRVDDRQHRRERDLSLSGCPMDRFGAGPIVGRLRPDEREGFVPGRDGTRRGRRRCQQGVLLRRSSGGGGRRSGSLRCYRRRRSSSRRRFRREAETDQHRREAGMHLDVVLGEESHSGVGAAEGSPDTSPWLQMTGRGPR
jgi:hypothetical protein